MFSRWLTICLFPSCASPDARRPAGHAGRMPSTERSRQRARWRCPRSAAAQLRAARAARRLQRVRSVRRARTLEPPSSASSSRERRIPQSPFFPRLPTALQQQPWTTRPSRCSLPTAEHALPTARSRRYPRVQYSVIRASTTKCLPPTSPIRNNTGSARIDPDQVTACAAGPALRCGWRPSRARASPAAWSAARSRRGSAG